MNTAYDPDGNIEFAKMLTMVNQIKYGQEPARFTARAYAAKGKPHIFIYSLMFSFNATNDAVWCIACI
jgi:para-nitrobenzyl esterase